MRPHHASLAVLLATAACGDSGSTTASASDSASGTGDTGAAASTGAVASTGTDTPTTGDAGSQSASESQGTTSTGLTEASGPGDSGESGATTASTDTGDLTGTTGSLSATDTGTTQDDGSTGSSTGPACVDECPEGQSQCDASGEQQCIVNDLGCTEWSEPVACGPGEVCVGDSCGQGCADECEAGSKQCIDDGVSSCVDDPMTTCTVWSDPVACAPGKVCEAGTCVTPPALCLEDCVFQKQQVNASVDFYSVWGSSAKAVWTVGASGTALYYNGVTWKAVDSGVGTRLECVHGSAANDVYAITGDAQIIRFDGTEWLPLIDLNPTWGESACLSVIGTKDLLASVYDSNGAKVHLYHIKDGVKTLLDTATPQDVFTPDGSKISSMSLRAFSATAALATADRAYRWTGADLVNMAAPNPSYGLWALAPDFAYAAASHSGIGHRWDGQTWKIVNPGLNGYLHMFTGTAKDRIFGVGETKVGTTAAIVSFDGIGWSPAVTPADAKSLYAAWSAATGEVFAVGKAGTILIGK